MLNYGDPETMEFKRARFSAAVTEFHEVGARDPGLGRALFRSRLIALHFTPREIETEITVHAPMARGANVVNVRLAGANEGK